MAGGQNMSTPPLQSASIVYGPGVAYGYCTRMDGWTDRWMAEILHSSASPLHRQAHTMETAPCHTLGLSLLSPTLSGSGENTLGMQMEPLTVSRLQLHLYRTKQGELF